MPRVGMPVSAESAQPVKKILRFVVQLAFVVLLIFFIYFIVHKHNENTQNKKSAVKPTSLNAFEQESAKTDQSFLNGGDYTSYQSTKNLLASQFLAEHDIADAERVMNDVLVKVPKDKIVSQTYYTMVNIEKAKNDKTGIKQYLQLLIAKLQAEGDTKSADAWQKYLDGLK